MSENEKQLKRCLANMTKTQRRRYKQFLDGKNVGEIATKEGVSVGAVSNSLRLGKIRARNRLSILKIK